MNIAYKEKPQENHLVRRAELPLQLIHSDICGPMNVRARHGASYFITFIDDYTRYGHVYLISLKSQALDCFIQYINEVENQLDKKKSKH